jgi:signal transduction histidine kinase
MGKSDGKAIKVGIAATVVGAAAGAAGVYLSDKKNRDKAAKQLDKAKKWSDKTLDEWKNKADDLHLHDKAEELKHQAKEKADDLKDNAVDKVDRMQMQTGE